MKTILFDFDGTIADTFSLTVKLFNSVASEYGLPLIDGEDVELVRNLSAKELLKKYPLSPWKLLRLVTQIQSLFKKEMSSVTLITGMDNVLKELEQKNIRIGIVTSNAEENIRLFLKKQNITSVEFIYSEKNIFGKGKVLKNVIKKRQLQKGEVWYVGDEVRDIDAAHQAGIPVLAVAWGFNTRERLATALPDFLVNSPQEFLHVIENLP